jgi:TPP-dependent pyruvate/acetoin dehydrogenase alpha subunit
LPENPLLPHRKLQELYTLMQRCRALDLKQARAQSGRRQKASRPIAREALLAATSIHLLPGDLLCAQPGDRTTEQLAPAPKAAVATSSLLAAPELSSRLLLCAAAARGLQATCADGLVLAFADTHSPAASSVGWAAALEWAQSAQLPLLLACIDSSSTPAAPSSRRTAAKSAVSPLDLPSMNRLAHRLRLPVMPVDGEDAVAVYRVMQESALRARLGGGPAVLWALMNPSLSLKPTPSSRASGPRPASQPIARLRSYLVARQIPVPK